MITIKSLPDLWIGIARTFNTFNHCTHSALIKYYGTHGDSFMTTNLPSLGKSVDKSLSSGQFAMTKGLFKTQRNSPLPIFMKEYFNKIYTQDGYLRDRFDPALLKELRTLLFMFYKKVENFSDDTIDLACQKFVENDDSVKTDFTEEQIERIKDSVRECFPNNPFDIRLHHSNGATAEKASNVMKRHFKGYIPELMRVYNFKYFFNTVNHARLVDSDKPIEPYHPDARVTFVPKDSRGPRTICMEPFLKMMVQKGQQDKIYNFIESPLCPAYKKINFTDQTINQRLAYESSITQEYATIDMKDASDLVPWELVSRVVSSDWLDALTASRSAFAVLPNGKRVKLKKFAPMGSALCFPIEAIIFYAIACTVTKDVRVYGDDIIVPTCTVHSVMAALQEYGMKVNEDKSLFTGFFRESCGVDCYRGFNITPIRYKKDDLISVVAFANNMCDAFGDLTGEAVIRWRESITDRIILRLHPRYREHGTGLICYYTDRDNSILFPRRYNKDLHRYELRSLTQTAKPLKRTDCGYPLSEGYNLFFDWLTTAEGDDSPELSTYIKDNNRCIESDYSYTSYSGRTILDLINSQIKVSSSIGLSKPKVCYQWAEYISG